MRRLRYFSAFSGLLVFLAATISLSADPAAVPTFTLDPTPSISGSPGSTVGWGFTIDDNNTGGTDYMEITSSQFCTGTVNFPLICNSPVTGAYTDFISTYSDILLGPSGGTEPVSASQSFDGSTMGVGSFAINPFATVGTDDVGEIVLTYNLYDSDPNVNEDYNTLATDLVLSANASVTVTGAAVPSAPEPATGGVLAIGLLALGFGRLAVTRRHKIP